MQMLKAHPLFSLPPFYCPVPSALHPEAAAIEAGTLAWLKRFGYIEHPNAEQAAQRAQFGMHAARVHPRGDARVIQISSDLTVWLFLTDDVFIEEPGRHGRFEIPVEHAWGSLRILRDPDTVPAAANPSLLALRDIALRTRAFATPEQIDRITQGMVEFFLAGFSEAVAFSRNIPPKLVDYVNIRDAINCLRSLCFVFIEIVGGYTLPGATWCHPELQAVVNIATRIVSNHHDVLSGVRELSDELPMNMPAVLRHERDLPLDKTFAQVVELANADMRRFISLSDHLVSSTSDPGVARYVEGLKSWIRGNLDWSLMTGRYRVQERVGPIEVHA